MARCSRREARTSPDGVPVLLGDQDRSRWDAEAIDEGGVLAERALRMGRPGPYQIQAAIAHLHCLAPNAESTDWPQIAALYAKLDRISPSPVIRLNGAVAVALSGDVEGGLEAIDSLGAELADYRHYHSARADLLRRLDRTDEAVHAYEAALATAGNERERRFLEARLAEVRS